MLSHFLSLSLLPVSLPSSIYSFLFFLLLFLPPRLLSFLLFPLHTGNDRLKTRQSQKLNQLSHYTGTSCHQNKEEKHLLFLLFQSPTLGIFVMSVTDQYNMSQYVTESYKQEDDRIGCSIRKQEVSMTKATGLGQSSEIKSE